MACRTLLRRRTQLALLAAACEQHAPALVSLRRQRAISGEARLVSLERDGVLLEWAEDAAMNINVANRPVEVRFRHGDAQYVFYATFQGAAPGSEPHGGRNAKLSLPLRVEGVRHREQIRLNLADVTPISATFTHVIDARHEFKARLTDVGDGGIGVRARGADIGQLHTGDLFWFEPDVPDLKTRCEFVVRLAHLRPLRNSDHVAMGWAFQPTDDSDNHQERLRHLESFIAHQRALSGPDATD